MLAVEEKTLEADLPAVVRLGEHAVDLGVAQRLAGIFGRVFGLESSFFQGIAQS
ncbi:hypothetical protein [Mycobacterium sp. UM_CSW]|uniref:hypothetical protein n=1 Tax=Mycobacterium sp. UM_CSW TaxID=1370119 RepID=UPI001376F00E|nr:hypothetical protein [Mycobacterium sp. UM_CSW]